MNERREAIKERLNKVFREIFDDTSINVSEDMTAKDIDEWDSLKNINLIVAIEKEFEVKFMLSELVSLQDVGAMIDLIEKKIK